MSLFQQTALRWNCIYEVFSSSISVLQNYRVSVPVSGGGQLTLSGRLDNSVREVGLASSAEQGSAVTNGGIGLVRLVALTPRALCFWQLQMSPNVANVTAMHVHQGGPSECGSTPLIIWSALRDWHVARNLSLLKMNIQSLNFGASLFPGVQASVYGM